MYYFKICYFIQVSAVDNLFLRDMITGMISYIDNLTAFQSRFKNILVTPLLGDLKGWCLVLGTDHKLNSLGCMTAKPHEIRLKKHCQVEVQKEYF